MKQVILAAALAIATAAQALKAQTRTVIRAGLHHPGHRWRRGLCGAAYLRRRHAESALLIDCLPPSLDTPSTTPGSPLVICCLERWSAASQIGLHY